MTGRDIDLSDYVDVAERVRLFRQQWPEGSLQPVDPAHPFEVIQVNDQTFIVYVAAAYRHPNDPRPGIGTAWEPFPGRTPYTRDSELQNAETAAWGRAIIATLAADSKKVASLDEVRARKAANPTHNPPQTRQDAPQGPKTAEPATDPQRRLLRTLAHDKGQELPPMGNLTKRDAMKLIDAWKELPDATAGDADTLEEPF